MRKNIFALFALLCIAIPLHAEKCELKGFISLNMMYPAVQINLFDEHRLDLSKISSIEPPVKLLRSDSTQKAYKASSDSTIIVFLVDDQISFFKICSSKTECDSLAYALYIENLIIEEFERLQPAGVFPGTAAEADSVIRHIVQMIKSIYGPGVELDDFSFSGATYNNTKATEDQDKAGIVVHVAGLCSYNRFGRNYQFCGLIDSVRECPQLFQQEEPPPLKSPVPRTAMPETKFRAFDLNGNFIRSGIWREDSADEFRTPTIVRFENGHTLPLYRARGR